MKCLCSSATSFPPASHIVQYTRTYKRYALNTWCLLLSDDTCIHATDRKEDFVLRKLQRGLSAIETWCERWYIKINEDKSQAIYFSHRLTAPETHLILNGRNIPFVSHVIYLGVIFNKKITCRVHIEIKPKGQNSIHSDPYI
jgi:hypothetical protein